MTEGSGVRGQAVASLGDAIGAGSNEPDELKEPDFDAVRGRDDFKKLRGGGGGQVRGRKPSQEIDRPRSGELRPTTGGTGSPWPSWVRTSNRTVPRFRVGSLDLADHDRMRQRGIPMPLRDHFRPPVWNQASRAGNGSWNPFPAESEPAEKK